MSRLIPQLILIAATCTAFAVTATRPGLTMADEVTSAVSKLNEVGPDGRGHAAAMEATGELLGQSNNLFETLGGMADAKPRAKNWLRMIASQQIERADAAAKQNNSVAGLDESLLNFLKDRTNDGDARYLVYRHLVDRQPERRESLLEVAVDDPFIPLRFLAIEQAMKNADELEGEASVEAYLAILPLARHPNHLRDITAELKTLGNPVQLSEQLAMMTRWNVIAPFNNRDGIGFESVYAVESDYAADPASDALLSKTYVADPNADAPRSGDRPTNDWQVVTTDDDMGMVNLNPPYENAKDAVAYAVCFFDLPESETTDAQVRLGCINANKVWINGKLCLSNEIYHSGDGVDQYVAGCKLQPGRNSVLLKICQNNQTQPWAQDWQFQIRLTDSTGRGIPVTTVRP